MKIKFNVFLLTILIYGFFEQIFATKIVENQNVKNTNFNFVKLAKIALPATVVVQGSREIPQRNISNIFDLFEGFDGFLGKDAKDYSQKTKKTKVKPSGSGFVIDCVKSSSKDIKKGKYQITVVTNYHVIKGLTDYYVSIDIDSGIEKKYKASMVGFDEFTDIAVLKIFISKPINSVKWSDSSKLQVGEYCLVAGAPMGMSKGITTGVISHVSQAVYKNPGSVVDGYIQTDAAVNGGNSGGGIFNTKGEVVAVVVFKISQAYGEGMSYGIPSNTAKKIVNKILKSGKVTRGWIGVSMQILDYDLALALGMDKPKGVIIRSVDGPSKGKLFIGDVILKANDKQILTYRDMRIVVANSTIGDVIKCEVLRNGKKVMIGIKTQLAPQTNFSKQKIAVKNNNVEVSELTEKEKKLYGLKHGVKISKVNHSYRFLRSGDVIVSVNNIEVKNAKNFSKLIIDHQKNHKNKPLILYVYSPKTNDRKFVTIKIG